MSLAPLKEAIRARLGARSGIAHSVGTLVGGTAFAQVIAALALPILTRLYTPAEFSVLAVYASLLGILAVIACMRLEIGIPLPEHDEEAASLLVLALATALVFSLAIGMVVALFPDLIIARLRLPSFRPFLWLVPLGVWVSSTYAAVQYWATRKKKFSKVARTRMTQTLSGAAIQIGAGSLGAGPIGLLLGQMVSGGAGAFGLGRDAFRNSRAALRTVSLASMRKALARYSRLPKYSTPDALANSLGAQAPVIIIAALTIGPEAGYLALATRVMAAPMALVGGSIAQVYLAHAPEELRANRLGQFTTRILGGLFKTGVGPLIFAGIVAAPAFSIAFGPDWRRAGELVSWMTPWFVLQFVSSPVSMVVHVMGRQRAMLMLTITGLCIRVGAVLAAARIGKEFLPEAYAIASAIFYTLCTVVFYRLAGVKLHACLGAAKGSARILAGWVLAGLLVLGALDAWLRL